MVPTKPKARMFDKLHKPYRRRAVLNSLFIKNITDVISTRDIMPEIINYGVEITGVQVSPCYKILNVYWQVPVSHFGSCEDIEQILNKSAPKIRAELISRNVMGHVPIIFFLRDCTNSRVAAFEEAMQKIDLGPESDSSIIVDDSFTDDIYSFKESKVDKPKSLQSDKNETKKKDPAIPEKPSDMKCDVFGLDHDVMMGKVFMMKKKFKNPPEQSAVISPSSLTDENDLFSKIPGVCFQTGPSVQVSDREAILKKFNIERKMLKQQNKNKINQEDYHYFEEEDNEDNTELHSFCGDFIDDETTDMQ